MSAYLKSGYDLTNPDIVSVIDDLPLWSAPFGLKLLEVVKLRKHINVLDIGSGNGFPLIELSQRLGHTCKVYGIDPWKEAVARTRLKIQAWKLTNVEVIEGVAQKIPFADDYFDLIVSNNGINNVEDDEKVMQEISRVSKTGAQLVVTINLPETMIEFYDVYEKILQEQNKMTEINKLQNHIFTKRKPISYTRQLITNAGFKIVDIYEDSFTFDYTDGSTMLDNHIIMLAFLESWKSILNEEDVESIFSLIEKELNEVAEIQGKLTLTIPWVCLDCYKK